jgi:hypothetical protein
MGCQFCTNFASCCCLMQCSDRRLSGLGISEKDGIGLSLGASRDVPLLLWKKHGRHIRCCLRSAWRIENEAANEAGPVKCVNSGHFYM